MKGDSSIIAIAAIAATLVCGVGGVSAREIHVAKTGNDSRSGDRNDPFLTINKGASVARPGDTVIVHAGTYREWVIPPRGGAGENERITYRAAPNEEVLIKGSERVSWVREGNGVWKAELPSSFFGGFNPYAQQVSGNFLQYGKWHHLGDVYLKGEALYEKETAGEVAGTPLSWHCQVDGDATTIRANFGAADPNRELTEINVRESLLMPAESGLNYITIDGFHFLHAAANWAPPTAELQGGAIGPRMGKRWVIQNCTITHARAVGIILGRAPGTHGTDIDTFGDHLVRNNVIRRCGQSGIAGVTGATRSLIGNNLIEDTNFRREFGGAETAAIKFHATVDTVIRRNLIRGVYQQGNARAEGIWIDWGNQGTRISGNIIYNTTGAGIYMEMNHGPILVDNNVLIGSILRNKSSSAVIAHNLFLDCGYVFAPDKTRTPQYWKPHTNELVERKSSFPGNNKWFNNIFVRKGLDTLANQPGCVSDYNAFLDGAKPSPSGDEHSLVSSDAVKWTLTEHPLGATISFSLTEPPSSMNAPWVNAGLIGVFPVVRQSIEDRDGKPITVDVDINGASRPGPIAGPLANPKRGQNTITWMAPD